jgi:hypothetical protein
MDGVESRFKRDEDYLMPGRRHCFKAHSEKYASFGKMHLGGQLFFSHVTTDSKHVQNIEYLDNPPPAYFNHLDYI